MQFIGVSVLIHKKKKETSVFHHWVMDLTLLIILLYVLFLFVV